MLTLFLTILGKAALILCVIVVFAVVSYVLVHSAMSYGLDSIIENLKKPNEPKQKTPKSPT